MSTPKGYPFQGKREDHDTNEIQPEAKHTTVVPKSANRRGLDVVGGGYAEVATGLIVEALSTDSRLVLTGHSFLAGDLVRFLSTVNPINELEIFVERVIDANTILFSGVLSDILLAGDTVEQLRFISEKVAPDGSSLSTIAAAPIQILKGPAGVFLPVTVTKDTSTPANTQAVPVEIVAASGTNISITADNIDVQTSHLGANPDSVQIGNGTTVLEIEAVTGKALVKDQSSIDELQLILAKLLAAPSTEAKQDTVITALGSLLTELGLKADLTETQPVSAATLPLPTGAATQVTLAALLSELQDKADLTDTQPVSIASAIPITAGVSTEAKQDAVITAVGLLAKLTDTQPISAAALPLPTGAGTEAKQDDIITELQSIAASTTAYDNRAFVLHNNNSGTGGTNILAIGGTTVIANIGANPCSEIKITCTFGTFMELLVNGTPKGIIPKGGFSDGFLKVAMPANASIGFRSLSGSDITAGEIVVNVQG